MDVDKKVGAAGETMAPPTFYLHPFCREGIKGLRMERAKEKHPEGCLVFSRVWVSCTTPCAVPFGPVCCSPDTDIPNVPMSPKHPMWQIGCPMGLVSSSRYIKHLGNSILHRAWYRIPKREKEPAVTPQAAFLPVLYFTHPIISWIS